MLTSSRLVVAKNIIISLVTIFVISLASSNLNSDGLILISTFMLFFNLQNSLFEGLFGLHLLSIDFNMARKCIARQFKYKIVSSITASVLFYIYLNSVGIEQLPVGSSFYFFVLIVFLCGLITNSVMNIYSNVNEVKEFFLLDIVFLLISLLVLLVYRNVVWVYFLPFLFRTFGSIVIYFRNMSLWKLNGDEDDCKLTSVVFFSSTVLSVLRDSLFPLVCGYYIGPNIIVLLRIFNTIVSAPGLLASSVNKVIVRNAQQNKDRALLFNKYIISLYILSMGYFAIVLVGGERLIRIFFSDKFNVSFDYLIISLFLFGIFWPWGQLLMVKSLVLGKSMYYVKISFYWTVLALINFIVLYYTEFTVYIVFFGFMQLLNVVLYVKFSSNANENKK
ncbi:hypothetical protein N5D88_14625 [Aeromonas caviae]|uniref:hypothetical protein n=1 Tax=Aeromonas caviae TaxID=648 RepID=UPI002447EE8E|nr:hypothetical protein [Aeromonas caviae]MDH1841625.1 hypothetical protein [Aeromonas caviae]